MWWFGCTSVVTDKEEERQTHASVGAIYHTSSCQICWTPDITDEEEEGGRRE